MNEFIESFSIVSQKILKLMNFIETKFMKIFHFETFAFYRRFMDMRERERKIA